MTEQGTSKDFFVSYNQADRGWAEWIAWQLQTEGYSVVLQAWDFRPGGNFVLQMDEAATQCRRTLAVLSPNYLDRKAGFSHAEWAAALVQDPEGQQAKLLPVRVRKCQPTGLLASITYIDLVNQTSATARSLLLEGVRRSRALPALEPLYPGQPPAALPPSPSFPGEWPLVWNVPYQRNPFFTGREELLKRVHEQLATSQPTALTQARAISGLGGIGKTQTALEYAHRYGREYQSVLWVSAASADTLLSGFVQLATLLQLPGQDGQDQQKTVEAVKRWLAQQRDWLLILDNADDLNLAAPYLSQGNRLQGHVLLTTRASTGGALAQIIEVEKMDQEEGVLLLLRRAHLLAPDAPLERANQQDRATAQAIVSALDGLPLALDQAGAYLEEAQISLSAYLSLYQTRRKDLLARRGQFPPGHPETVATTWSLAFQQVEQANPAAADLLRLCTFLAPDVIPEDILTQGAPVLGKMLQPVASVPMRFDDAIQELRRYSLLKRNPETKTLSIHRLVQVTLQDTMSPKVQQQWAERAVRALSEVFPFVDYGTWRQAQPYLPHAEICQSLIEHYRLVFPQASLLLHNYGVYFYHTGKYQQAEPLLQSSLRINEQALGPEHPKTGASLYQLAQLYLNQGKYERVESLLKRSLHICEQTQGPEHPDTATSLHELARLYQHQSKYEEAEPLYQRALGIYEQALGLEHPKTAATLHQLAQLYLEQSKYEQAESLYQRSLHIKEQALGPEHPDTAHTLNDIALLYQKQSKYEQAEMLCQRALGIYERTLGPEHPYTAITLYNLALLYYNQSKYEEAEPLYQRALRINEQALGPEHSDTANVLHALALLYQDQGKYKEAEPLYQRVLRIKEQMLDPKHPGIAVTLYSLASLYQDQGKYKEAEPLYQRALALDEQAFGIDHPEVATDLAGYASLLSLMKRTDEAKALEARAKQIHDKHSS